MSARYKAYLYLTIVAAIWGIAGPIIKHTLSYFDPILFLTLRFFITSLVFIPLLFKSHPRLLKSLSQLSITNWKFLIVSSLLGSTINLGFLFWGFSLTTSIDGTVINASSPILVTLASVYFLGEHITNREKAGQLLAFAGSLIIILQPILESGHLFSGSLYGNLLVFLADLAWVGYVTINKRQLRMHFSPLFLTAAMFFFGFLSMSIILILTHSPSGILQSLSLASYSSYLGVLYMALLSGGLAYWLYNKGEKTIESSEANIFNYLQPLFAIPVGYLWLGEAITIPFIVGSLVIAAGVLLAQTKFHRR